MQYIDVSCTLRSDHPLLPNPTVRWGRIPFSANGTSTDWFNDGGEAFVGGISNGSFSTLGSKATTTTSRSWFTRSLGSLMVLLFWRWFFYWKKKGGMTKSTGQILWGFILSHYDLDVFCLRWFIYGFAPWLIFWASLFPVAANLRKPGSESFNLMFMWERSLQLKKDVTGGWWPGTEDRINGDRINGWNNLPQM